MIYKTLWKSILIILFVHSLLFGQAQNDPAFSFDNGLNVVAPDSSASLNFTMYLQNRIDVRTLSTNDWSVDEFTALIKRFRMKFTGFLMDPRLTYKIQLTLAPGNVSSTTMGQAPRVMYDAIVYYQFSPRFKLGFGQTAIPGNRQRLNSSSALQLVDRSMMNSAFNIDLDFGLQGEYKFNPSGERPLVFHGAITTGEGQNWVVVEKAGFSYTGRLDWYPLGSFLSKGSYKEGDLEWHPEPRLMLGVSYNYNDDAQRLGGQRGGLLFSQRDISTLFADFIFKHKGLAFQGDYAYRTSEDPVTFDPDGSSVRTVLNGQGYNFQLSKYFRSKWEVVGQVTGVIPDEEIDDISAERRELTLGLNRYIKGRDIKLQTDVTLHQARIGNDDFAGHLVFQFQAQIGF